MHMKKLLAALLAVSMLLACTACSNSSTPAATATPVVTEAPTEAPTEVPTEVPTEEPTEVPTEEPTEVPTEVPTMEPTPVPTEVPTEEPTAEPTEVARELPTEEPVAEATEAPTEVPTEVPTMEPTPVPTEVPTEEPTAEPTEAPTEEPTAVPTEVPTEEPTIEPTEAPAEETAAEPIEVSAAEDTDPVVITVGDTTYTYSQVQSTVDYYLSYLQQYYYQNYYYTIDITDPEIINNVREVVYNGLVQEIVLNKKSTELGLDVLTDEEKASVEEQYNYYFNYLASYMGVDTTQEIDDSTRETLEYYVYYYFGVTKDILTSEAVSTKLENYINADVTVSEEDVQAAYDAAVEVAKASYESDLSTYGSAVLNGETVYYRPAGYRYIKNLLIMDADEDTQYVSDLTDKASEYSTAMTTAKTAVEAVEGADLEALAAQVTVTVTDETPATATDTDTETRVVPTLVASAVTTFEATEDADQQALQQNVIDYATAKALYDAYTALAADAATATQANTAARADAALARLAAGEDFNTVMAELTEDPGMTEGATFAATGYPICANNTYMDTVFTEAAMSIPEVGGYSDKALGSYGYYICYYAGDIEEGAVPLADVYDELYSTTLTSAQEAHYQEVVNQWVEESGAVIDRDAMDRGAAAAAAAEAATATDVAE